MSLDAVRATRVNCWVVWGLSVLAFAFNKQFFKGSSTEPRISHVLQTDLFNYSGSRVGKFTAAESVLKASFSPAETLILPAFPTGFTQLCSSSYVSPSQLSNPIPAHSPSPLPPTAPGCERPAPDSTHMEVNLRGAELKTPTDLVSSGTRKRTHNLLLPDFSAVSKLYVQTPLKKGKKCARSPQKHQILSSVNF